MVGMAMGTAMVGMMVVGIPHQEHPMPNPLPLASNPNLVHTAISSHTLAHRNLMALMRRGWWMQYVDLVGCGHSRKNRIWLILWRG